MAVAFGLTSCPSGLVTKSKLLQSPEAQYGFFTKHSRHCGKTLTLRVKQPKLKLLFRRRMVCSVCQEAGSCHYTIASRMQSTM